MEAKEEKKDGKDKKEKVKVAKKIAKVTCWKLFISEVYNQVVKSMDS